MAVEQAPGGRESQPADGEEAGWRWQEKWMSWATMAIAPASVALLAGLMGLAAFTAAGRESTGVAVMFDIKAIAFFAIPPMTVGAVVVWTRRNMTRDSE